MTTPTETVVNIRQVSLRYQDKLALDNITLDIPANYMVGLIGPDGVGKSSLMSLITGSRVMQQGRINVLGGAIANAKHRRLICPRIAYMPQGLGKNLYLTLSVFENIDFFGRLFGHDKTQREHRINDLLNSTGLAPFRDRPAGKLSGGMKQKLGLCCALIHDPDLLVLDEPTTGVDPLSRVQFWELIGRLRAQNSQMSIIVSTAYIDEAERFDWLVAMNDGKILATGAPNELLEKTNADNLESAFIRLLPEDKRRDYKAIVIPPRVAISGENIAIEAHNLTMRFDGFVAVDNVNLRINRGEIFGFLGSNGCGKTTTMKMLTGLLQPSAEEAKLFGRTLDAKNLETRKRVGYMSQAFSLYSELTVRQNLELHAKLFHIPKDQIADRINEVAQQFSLAGVMDDLPDALPLGIRQRLSLAVAVIHKPDLLILDEPTSGVDPIARDKFWELMINLSRQDQVTIFISTHFMNEAERCDRISLMHAGKVLASDKPEQLIKQSGCANLEETFIAYLKNAVSAADKQDTSGQLMVDSKLNSANTTTNQHRFSKRRLFSYTLRETLELHRDPIRSTIALLGTLFLMIILAYGFNFDVENLRFAVLDRDQTQLSNSYVLNLSGSRYFIEQEPISDYNELDRRMRSSELSLAIEIPPNFARDVARGDRVKLGVWIDGAMPTRAENILGYVQFLHQDWLEEMARRHGIDPDKAGLISIETRYRYNPDVESIQSTVPSVIPMLVMLISAMLSALSVVREKELGSIINLYVTPVTKLEFIIGKQLPYIVLGMVNFLLLCALAVFYFGVPVKGDFLLLLIAALLYVIISTGLGLLVSAFTRSQVAAIYATAIFTVLPTMNFSGLTKPITSMEGGARFFGELFPASHFLIFCRGIFSKGLGYSDLEQPLLALSLAVLVIMATSVMLLKKQES